jgi:S1-C subfamily serine protease
MTSNRYVTFLIIIVMAGFSSLLGVVVGGALMYRFVRQSNPVVGTALPAVALPTSTINPNQMLEINTTEIQTTITEAARNTGPAVVTVVGTIPGQMTFFGPTGDQTVSGSGFFISEDGYLLTNYHVVGGVEDVSLILSDGSQINASLVGGDVYSDLAVLRRIARHRRWHGWVTQTCSTRVRR